MSPLLVPDVPQIEASLDKLLERDAQARVLGLRSPMRRKWPDSVTRRGRRFRLAWCASELEIREQLEAIEADGAEGVVVLTPLDPARLGCDVMARLPRGRLEQSDRWTALRGAFQARDVDPRLRPNRWLADLLLERAPIGGYPPAASGVLDLEAAWRALLEQGLGLPEGRADAVALLDWTLDVARLERFAALAEEVRAAIAERLARTGGAGTRLVLAAAAVGRGADALPLGLVCGVVFGEDEARPALREAAVRLEPLVGGVPVAPQEGRGLAAAARRVLSRLVNEDSATARAVQARANTLLTDVRAEAAAAISPALDLGLEARMKDAAAALTQVAASCAEDDTARAWALVDKAKAHDRAAGQPDRVERLVMAARLARWLASGRPSTSLGMAEAAAAYAADGGYADRARNALRAGDALPEVATAYARLREVAAARREEANRAFAAALRDWNAAVARGIDPFPVERLLDAVVVPLAREAPVLLLLLDGLSFAVWCALAETVTRLGWTELCQSGRPTPLVGVAALPSVTEISRTTLLCGTLVRGDQATERAGFAAHPGLMEVSAAGRPPRLFHKADLGAGPELEAGVGDAIADPRQRIVGVVHNAVDAQLSGSDQIDVVWSAEGLRQVAALLRVTRDAGRVIVVTGDHGHVVDNGTSLGNGGSGNRWRAGGPAADGEVILTGGRVLSPEGGHTVVAAWSERLRYGAPRSGYHGGASPQEVLVPVAVLAAGEPPSGWDNAPPAEPGWWRGSLETIPAVRWPAQSPAGPLPARRRTADTLQPELFATAPLPAAPDQPIAVGPAWIGALLACDAYAAQRRLAGRGAPDDQQVRSLLVALSGRGGRLSRTSLAQTLAAPTLRVIGVVNAARRVLNLDQAQVLALDGDDVVLNERLLRVQFGLGDG